MKLKEMLGFPDYSEELEKLLYDEKYYGRDDAKMISVIKKMGFSKKEIRKYVVDAVYSILLERKLKRYDVPVEVIEEKVGTGINNMYFSVEPGINGVIVGNKDDVVEIDYFYDRKIKVFKKVYWAFSKKYIDCCNGVRKDRFGSSAYVLRGRTICEEDHFNPRQDMIEELVSKGVVIPLV